MKLDSTGQVGVTHEWLMKPIPKDYALRAPLAGMKLLLRGEGGCTTASVFRECDYPFWTHYSPIPAIGDDEGVALERPKAEPEPIPMRLPCPTCGTLHVDEGEFATKPHHTHACQECGSVFRPALLNTVGVKFLPGYKT